jgi:hypothetical protein
LEWGSDFFEYSTKVLSVFSEGFVITSPRRLRTGSVLSLRIRVPSDRLDIAFWESRCIGLVVSEQKLKDGRFGYRVQMENSLPD